MDCARARELVDLDAAGELADDVARELRSHCESCAECAALLADARAAAELTREALRHFEPGESFEAGVLARIDAEPAAPAAPATQGRPRTRRMLWLAAPAAAAAVILAVTLVIRSGSVAPPAPPTPPTPAARLLAGKLPGGGTSIAEGEKMSAAAELPLGLPGGTRALVAKGSHFTFAEGELRMAGGSCYMVSASNGNGGNGGDGDGERARPVAPRLSASGLDARISSNAEVYLITSLEAPAPASGLAALLDVVFPPVYAEGRAKPGALLLVFRGSASVKCDGRTVELAEGQGVFADACDEPFEMGDYIKRCEMDIAGAGAAAAAMGELAPEIARYRGVVASYERSLAAKRLRREEIAGEDGRGPELAELELRTRLVEEALSAHRKRLAGMLAGTAEGRSDEIADLKLRMELVREGERGHVSAVARLMSY